MRRIEVDVVVIGAGPAGLAAATAASEAGAAALVLERNDWLGGILPQCIHDGFGLHHYGESLAGPQYAGRLAEAAGEAGVDILTNSMVLELTPERHLRVATEQGLREIEAGAVILAMGCRERPRGAVEIPGSRPAGIFTAGTAQNLMNLKNIKPGNEVVILGSGDVGLIMARHVALEQGMKIKGIFEREAYVGGLLRNKVQCVDDFDIPLHLSSTVTEIKGKHRLKEITVADLDSDYQPLPETERTVSCDTLLLSVGLIPENELSRQAGVEISPLTGGARVDNNYETTVPGIFSTGNVLHIHDVADYAVFEGYEAGEAAVNFVRQVWSQSQKHPLHAGRGIQYVLPQYLRVDCRSTTLKFRVDRPRRNVRLVVSKGPETLFENSYSTLLPAEMKQVEIEANSSLEEVSIYLEKDEK